ncbi:hypothetical protein FRC02_001871 [Tulasnella sp. 418]|nr:hypothetical protein FRC02_001871 [Tulasnella sp. 418]
MSSSFTRSLLLIALGYVLTIGDVALAAQCSKGYYNKLVSGNYVCTPCPEGYYQPNSNSYTTSCTRAQPGWYADGSSAAKEQKKCGKGFYSPGGTSSCTPCPAGTQCISDTNDQPQLCSPGQYQPNSGAATGNRCPNCPKGEFNNYHGATSCCKCCHGYYNDNDGQTGCQKCSDYPKFGGPIGSTSKNSCTVSGANLVPATCKQDRGSEVCPPTSGGGTNHPRRRYLKPKCAKGFKRCAVLHGRVAYECIDVANDLESCGGCIDFTNSPTSGRDCTSIEGVDAVSCIQGKCVVHSCQQGYAMTLGGKCVPALQVTNLVSRVRNKHRRHVEQ